MTDNVTTSYFQTQKKLSPKQARWQEFLAKFDYELMYKPGRMNVVADALRWKAELTTISQPQSNQLEQVKEGLEHDRHPGMTRTLALLQGYYYWPNMQDDVEVYVKPCLVCQQDKGV
ncbi:transposon Tf2-12 polyprotein [Tanacetum coccineum]